MSAAGPSQGANSPSREARRVVPVSAALPLSSDWRYGAANRDGVITIRVIWVAFVLSLLVHFAALWTSPPLVRSLHVRALGQGRALASD